MTTDNNPEINLPEKGSLKTGKAEDQPLFNKSILVAILGIAVVIVILLVYGGMQAPPVQDTAIPPQACAEKSLRYINDNLVSPGTSASLITVTESRGMYEMKIMYQETDMILYTTRDCSFLFTSRIDMNATPQGSRSNPQPAAPPIKTVRPVVDLYVMAFCPYGTQAESAMKTVAALLGSKADIRVRYITTVTGTTVSSVRSLHGMPEVNEDLRQICILDKNPEKFWDYISRFNEACYGLSQDADRLDACWRNVTAAAGIDTKSIESCAAGEEGLALLKADEALAGRDRADSSPTLVINGQEYTGSRTPDAYKQAICDRFETAPAECSTILPPVQGAVAGGNCG